MEYVDILTPPLFQKSGQIKSRKQAIQDGDWIGAFNLWIIQTDPEPAIIYQLRTPQSSWEPSKLDVSAGGNLSAGESMLDGLREAEEELGKTYNPEKVINVGRRLNVSPDIRGLERKTVVDIFMVTDNSSLDSYQLEEYEVAGVAMCPLNELLQLHKGELESFSVGLMKPDKSFSEYIVTKSSFPENWDNYHFKMTSLINRYSTGERDLVY